jgi:RNA polymerase sigma factor for flagellar operon FliA
VCSALDMSSTDEPSTNDAASTRAVDDAFVKEHEGFVRNIAGRVRKELDLHCELDDLVAWGFQGLIEARARFDSSRGVQFGTFAHYRVRGAVIDGVRKMAYLSRRAHIARKVAEAADDLLEHEAATRAASPEARADVQQTVQAIDDVLGKLTAAFVIASVGQDDSASPEPADEQLIRADESVRVREAVAKLPEREAKVVRGLYFEGRLLDDVAKELGVSKSWASRIHTKALALMKGSLSAE